MGFVEESAPAACEHAETTETVVESTCIAHGSKTVTCNACGETVSTEELPLADHTMADATCLLPSTCSVEGCGHTEGEALGHSYVEGVCQNGCGIAEEHVHSYSSEVIAPTCTDNGYTKHSCSCGHSYEDTVTQATGVHTDENADMACDSCGTVYEHAVIENVTVAELKAVATSLEMKQAYTVTGAVSSWKDGGSDATKYGNFNLSDGTGEILVYGATATESALVWDQTNGKYTYSNKQDFLTNAATKDIKIADTVTLKVVRTNYNGTAQLNAIVLSVVPHEHTYDSGVETAPTCTANGYTTYTCSGCAHTYTDDEVPATGHSYVGGVCSGCGHTEGATVQYDNLVLTFSSSTQNAVSSYTGSFNATIGSTKWTIKSFNNNNNGWDYIKAGSKNAATSASIATTTPIAGKVVTITITTKGCTPAQVTSAKLLVSTSSDFSNATEYTITLKSGAGTITIEIPEAAAVANAYYKLAFECAKTSSNGTAIQISQVDYKYIVV